MVLQLSKKPGILLVGNFLSSHVGTRSVCEDLSVHLSGAGWLVVETSHRLGRIPRLLDMLFTTLLRTREYNLAYVEVYSGPSFIWAEFVVGLLRCLHKPVVLVLHGGGLVSFAEKHSTRVVRLLKNAQVVVTPSLFLQAGLKYINSNIRYIPNAIDISLYPFRLRSKPAPKVVWLRAFHAIYHPELAILALSYLAKDFKEIQLTMIGPDKHDGSLDSVIALADKLGIRSHLSIIGSILKTDVPNKLADGDIFLNTTRFESFGVSVLEAAACGLPVVSTNVGELSYLWQDGKNALLVPADDPKEMANAIRRVLSEPGLAESLSGNARQKAEAYDWTHLLPKWENLFLEVNNV